jgi:predicted transposase YbfD/YdcC
MGKPDYSTPESAVTLVTFLAEIPDPRSRRGRRYEWLYLLTLIAVALLAGESTLVGISQWVEAQGPELVRALQPRCRCVPSMATLRRVLCRVSITALEAAVGAYVRSLQTGRGACGQVVTATGERLYGQAVDGKTVRCATAHGPVVHLVAVVSHEDGLVLAQKNTTVKLSEPTIAQELLPQVPLKDTVTTFDALHTSAKQAEQICHGGGHYLFVVKKNQAALYSEIDEAFTALPPANSWEAEFWQYETLALTRRDHGRSTHYFLESTTALNPYLALPDVAQVVRRTRTVRYHRSQRTTTRQEYLITSLPRSLVTLAQVAQLRRWHWTIENVTHYPRDVSFGEDRCHVHVGSAPEALAAFRNAVIALLHSEGWPYLPNGFRFCCAHLQTALRWLGALAT